MEQGRTYITKFNPGIFSVSEKIIQGVGHNIKTCAQQCNARMQRIKEIIFKKIEEVLCAYVRQPFQRFVFDVQAPLSENKVFGEEDSIPNTRIILVNGIFNTMSDFESMATAVSGIFQQKIYGTYSPTHGFLGDIINVIKGLVYGTFLVAAETLAENIHARLTDIGYDEKNPQNNEDLKGRVVVLSHSGGSLVLEIARRLLLTKQEASLLDVTTFGSCVMFSRGIFHKAVNVINKGDIIPIVCAGIVGNLLPTNTDIQYVHQEAPVSKVESHYFLSPGYIAALKQKKELLEQRV